MDLSHSTVKGVTASHFKSSIPKHTSRRNTSCWLVNRVWYPTRSMLSWPKSFSSYLLQNTITRTIIRAVLPICLRRNDTPDIEIFGSIKRMSFVTGGRRHDCWWDWQVRGVLQECNWIGKYSTLVLKLLTNWVVDEWIIACDDSDPYPRLFHWYSARIYTGTSWHFGMWPSDRSSNVLPNKKSWLGKAV